MGRPAKTESMRDFTKRARSILWRQDNSKKRVQFIRWKEKVESLKKNAGYTLDQAVVQASKDFPCLKKLFREYDISQYDPNPESHPDIPCPQCEDSPEKPQVECENREASYRENLNWAIQAAGKYLRTGETPQICPNDQSYYLYIQATESSKEFLQRLGQVESKGDSELDEKKLLRKSGRKSIREIEDMLSALDSK